MELESAARRMLLGRSDVRGYVQERVFKDKLLEQVQGTGRSAVVVRTAGWWSPADDVQTVEFPVLVVEFWADCTRDELGNKAQGDAEDRARAGWRVLKPLFHAPPRGQVWGAVGSDRGVRVVASKLWQGPFFETENDSHGSLASYGYTGRSGVKLGDCCVAVGQFAVQVG